MTLREELVGIFQDDPFCDDLPAQGTSQMRYRAEHYADAAIAVIVERCAGEIAAYLRRMAAKGKEPLFSDLPTAIRALAEDMGDGNG